MKNELCLPSLVFVLVLLLVYIGSGSSLRVYRNNEYEVSEIDKRLDIPHPGPSPRRHKHSLRRNRILVIDEAQHRPQQFILKRQNVAVPEGWHQHNKNVLKQHVATPGLPEHKGEREYEKDKEVSVRGRDGIENEDKYAKSDVVYGVYTAEDSQHQNLRDRYPQHTVLKRGKITHRLNEENTELEFDDDIKSLGRLVDKAEREIEHTRSQDLVIDKYPQETSQSVYLREGEGNQEPSLHQESQHIGQKRQEIIHALSEESGGKRQEIIHALNEENGKVEPEDDIESLGRRMDETGHEIKDAKYEQSPVADKHAAAATRYIISKIQEIQDKLFKRTGNKELEDKLNLMAPVPTKKSDRAIVSSNITSNITTFKGFQPSMANLTKTDNTSMVNKTNQKEKISSNKPQPAERRKIIPEEVVDKILEKFQQLKKEAKHIAVSESRHSVEHAEHTEGTEWKKDVTSFIQHSSSPSICSYCHQHVSNNVIRMAPKTYFNARRNNVTTTHRKHKKHIRISVTRHGNQKNAKIKPKLTPVLVMPGKQSIYKHANDTQGEKRTISILHDGRAILNLKSSVAEYDVSPPFVNNQQPDTTRDETFSSLQESFNTNPYADFNTKAGVAIPDMPPTLNMFNQGQKSQEVNIEPSMNQDIPPPTYNTAAFMKNQDKTLLDMIPEISKYALPTESEDTKPPISSTQEKGYGRQLDLAASQAQLFETGVAFPGQVPILFKNNKYMKNDKEITTKRESFPVFLSKQKHGQTQRHTRSINTMSSLPNESNNRNSFGISLPELLNLENDAQLYSSDVLRDVPPPAQTNLFPRGMNSYASNYHGTPIYPLRNLNNLNTPQRRVLPYPFPEVVDGTNEAIQVADRANRPQLESINLPSSATGYETPRMRSTIRRINDVPPNAKNDKVQQRSAMIAANMIANALQTELGINHPFILATNDPYKYIDKTLSESFARQNSPIQQGYNKLTYSQYNNNNNNNNNIVPQSLLNLKAELRSSRIGHNTDNNIVKHSETFVPDRVMNYENNSGKTPAELLELINAKFASERMIGK